MTSNYGYLLGNTLLFAATSSLLAVGMAIPLMLCVFKLRAYGRNLLFALIVFGAFIPLHVYASAWLGAFSMEAARSIISQPSPFITAVLVTAFGRVCLATLLLRVGVDLHGVDQEEAAWLETRRRGVLRHLVVPALVRSAVGPFLLLFALSSAEITVTDLLNVRTIAEQIFVSFQLSQSSTQVLADSLRLFAPLLLLWIVVSMVLLRLTSDITEPGYRTVSRVFYHAPRWSRILAATVSALLLIVSVVVPAVALLSRIGSWDGLIKGVSGCLPEFAYSLWTSLVSATLSSFVALWVVLTMQRKKRMLGCLGLISWIALLIPGSLVGIGLLHSLNASMASRWMLDTSPVVVLAQTCRVLPVAILLAVGVVHYIPTGIDDARRVDGFSTLQAYIFLHLPMLKVPIACLWLGTLIWSLGELDATLIVCPPGITTLPIRIFTMMHYGVYRDVAAAAVLMGLFQGMLALFATSFWLFRKKSHL